MTKRAVLGLVVVHLVMAAGVAAAAEEAERERDWALGWDNGIVLRRQLGLWHVGVTAGPNDRLADDESQVWNVDEPDSLQGRSDGESSEHRESGFVGLEIGRRVTAYRNFGLAATTGLQYRWADSRSETSWPWSSAIADGEDQRNHDIIRDTFESSWILALGVRLSWRPLPIIGLELKYGLTYEWYDQTETSWERYPGELEWDRRDSSRHRQSFNDYGFYNITSVAVMVWF